MLCIACSRNERFFASTYFVHIIRVVFSTFFHRYRIKYLQKYDHSMEGDYEF